MIICLKPNKEKMEDVKQMKIFVTTFYITLNLFLISCVGTIKQVDPISTQAASVADKNIINYIGITKATAISNGRVEVTFPAAEGDPDELAYVIRYDGQQIPVYVFASALQPDYRGLLKHTIINLQPDTNYSFSVQVRNIKTNLESVNNLANFTKTFNNSTAKYNGITTLKNLSGADGINGIEAVWSEAERIGTAINIDEVDPIEYQVTVIDSNFLNPGDMNNENFTEPNRKVFSVQGNKRSAIINGLKAGTKYFVQARAVHHGYSIPQNASNINYKKEQNTNYLEISTYSDNLGNINFNNKSLNTSYPSGIGGLYSLILSWTAPQGNFDHYRAYYSIDSSNSDINNFLNTANVDAICNGPETEDPNILCQFVDSNLESFLLTGLETNEKYNVALAICLSRACETGKKVFSEVISHTTTPPIANFRGITSISTAKELNKLDRMYLHFDSPDFTSGNISGLIVQFFGSDINNTTPDSLNDSSSLNTSFLEAQPFNYKLDTTIEISGIDPNSTNPYCFLITPFTYNNDGTKTLHPGGLIPQCKMPQIKGPSVLEFGGIDAYECNNANGSIKVYWTTPLAGIYSHFELFYIASSPSFNFGEAFEWQNNSYYRILIDPFSEFYTITNLQLGRNYRVGVITYYNYVGTPIRSEINPNSIRCDL